MADSLATKTHPKRKRHTVGDPPSTKPTKRSRFVAPIDRLSLLSDELLVRVLSLLPLSDLLNLASVSERFYHLSGDSQLWKQLYYSRFVLPRALRIPGFRDGSARGGKLHYSSRKAIWADGRRGGWVDMRSRSENKDSRNWKRQFKLRHNWSRGKCVVEELKVGRETSRSEGTAPHKMLVKVSEGIAVTADKTTGLRAWDLKSKELLTQISLGDTDLTAAPSCISIDDQNSLDDTIDIAIGFSDGGFGIWRLAIKEKSLMRRYRHERSSNGELIGVAFAHPYLLTATTSVLISLYTFEDRATDTASPPDLDSSDESHTLGRSESECDDLGYSLHSGRAFRNRSRAKTDGESQAPTRSLTSPFLLTSLKSHTSRAPIALSLRKIGGNTVASIAYTFSTLLGWSLGIQDLHLRPPEAGSKSKVDVISTRLAYTLPVHRSLRCRSSTPTSPTRQQSCSTPETPDDDGPINLCYTHPYLLATLPDNTLILHLCTSNSTSISISPGIRLWGHTSGISDAEITARGKAVSVSCRGEEIRVWELEGRADGRSIEVRPTAKRVDDDEAEHDDDERLIHSGTSNASVIEWDERRNWVGFDDEMVIVLKESVEGRESLMVYDFT